MASWEIKKANPADINKGNKFNNGDSVGAEDINAVVEAALYAQEVERLNKSDIPLIVDEVVNLSGTYSEDLVVGYTNSIDAQSLNKTPTVGETTLVHIKTADRYVYSALIGITGSINNSGYYPFVVKELLLLHDEGYRATLSRHDFEILQLQNSKANKLYRHSFGAVSFVSSQSTEYTPKEFVTAFASSLSTVFERKANPSTLALQWGKESDTVVTYVFVWAVGTDGKPIFNKQSFDVSNYTDSIAEI